MTVAKHENEAAAGSRLQWISHMFALKFDWQFRSDLNHYTVDLFLAVMPLVVEWNTLELFEDKPLVTCTCPHKCSYPGGWDIFHWRISGFLSQERIAFLMENVPYIILPLLHTRKENKRVRNGWCQQILTLILQAGHLLPRLHSNL